MSAESTQHDLVLLRRYIAARDASAFATLSRRYAGMVLAVARRVTGSEHDAEDVAQNCFLELARRAGEIRSSLPGWLHALAVTRSKNHLRDGAVRQKHERGAGDESTRSQLAANPSEPSWQDFSPHIDEAIASLPEELREPLVLHYLFDRPQADIARDLNISQPTVSRRIRLGIEHVRAHLQKGGLPASSAGVVFLLVDPRTRTMPVTDTLRASLGKLAVAGIAPVVAGGLSTAWILASVLTALSIAVVATLVLIRHSDSLTAAAITWTGNRAIIERVPPLIWGAGNSGQRTLVGALAAASQATSRPVNYETLMGDSGLAFCVRWDPVGSRTAITHRAARLADEEAVMALQTALGFKLKARDLYGRQWVSVETSAGDIFPSLKQGRPVITSERDGGEFAVVAGFDADKERLLVRGYNAPDGLIEAHLSELGGGVLFIGDALESLPRKDLVAAGLRRAVAWWDRPASDEGLLYGKAAFDRWVAETTALPNPTDASLHVLWRESWWNYDMLCDGHYHAANYLRRHASLFEPAIRDELLAAADQYARLEGEGLVDSVYKKAEGPWSPKTFENFSSTRPEQGQLFGIVRDIDAAAIAHLKKAIELMK